MDGKKGPKWVDDGAGVSHRELLRERTTAPEDLLKYTMFDHGSKEGAVAERAVARWLKKEGYRFASGHHYRGDWPIREKAIARYWHAPRTLEEAREVFPSATDPSKVVLGRARYALDVDIAKTFFKASELPNLSRLFKATWRNGILCLADFIVRMPKITFLEVKASTSEHPKHKNKLSKNQKALFRMARKYGYGVKVARVSVINGKTGNIRIRDWEGNRWGRR